MPCQIFPDEYHRQLRQDLTCLWQISHAGSADTRHGVSDHTPSAGTMNRLQQQAQVLMQQARPQMSPHAPQQFPRQKPAQGTPRQMQTLRYPFPWRLLSQLSCHRFCQVRSVFLQTRPCWTLSFSLLSHDLSGCQTARHRGNSSDVFQREHSLCP